MECKAELKEYNPILGEITLRINADRNDINALVGRDLKLTLTQYRERRSNDANRLFHLYSDRLADAMRMSKPKMKNYLLFHYGQKVRDENGDLVVIKTNANEEELISRSDIHCWYIKNAPDGTPMYVLLEHSRFYNSREMAILIDGVMAECKAQGIDTISPAEIEEIKQKWGIEVAKHNSR